MRGFRMAIGPRGLAHSRVVPGTLAGCARSDRGRRRHRPIANASAARRKRPSAAGDATPNRWHHPCNRTDSMNATSMRFGLDQFLREGDALIIVVEDDPDDRQAEFGGRVNLGAI